MLVRIVAPISYQLLSRSQLVLARSGVKASIVFGLNSSSFTISRKYNLCILGRFTSNARGIEQPTTDNLGVLLYVRLGCKIDEYRREGPLKSDTTLGSVVRRRLASIYGLLDV